MITNLDINFVSTQHNGYVFAHTLEVTVPVGHVLVRDSGRDIEHDDTALSLNVVTISKTTEFLLARGIPDVETDGAKVGRKC
jgi:hypothetical protein